LSEFKIYVIILSYFIAFVNTADLSFEKIRILNKKLFFEKLLTRIQQYAIIKKLVGGLCIHRKYNAG